MSSTIEIDEIRTILPQSEPFVMIDRIVEFKKGESLTAVKAITGNEWGMQGLNCANAHFPETLLVEAAAQAALIIYQLSKIQENENRPSYIIGKIDFNFQNFSYVGDILTINAIANKMMDTGGYTTIVIDVEEKNILEVEIFYSVIRDSKKINNL